VRYSGLASWLETTPKAYETTLTTLDRLKLAAALVEPGAPSDRAVALVHGGGVTREQGGFFTPGADGLAKAGVACLRFDLLGHGQSEGRIKCRRARPLTHPAPSALERQARQLRGCRHRLAP
jgi:alpha-beta hydrolase superfamily lysophospholipase